MESDASRRDCAACGREFDAPAATVCPFCGAAAPEWKYHHDLGAED